jgi:hypothetical protein
VKPLARNVTSTAAGTPSRVVLAHFRIGLGLFQLLGSATFERSITHGPLKSQRIDDFQERELRKIGISGADLPDAVLAHENCSVSIGEQITGEVRQLVNEFARDVDMTMGRDENGEAGRSD